MLLMIVYMCIIGSAIGSVSGLIPGIHVNTLAAIILTFHEGLETAVAHLVPSDVAPIMLACCVVSAAVVHSATDFVPSVFFGVPDPDNTTDMLPGHRLLLMGEGMTAVRCAAMGSLVGAFTSIILSIPMYFLLINGLEEYLDGMTVAVLISVLAMMTLRECRGRRVVGAGLIALSGILGCVTMTVELPLDNMFGMEPEPLFPLLSGLFGIPALLISQQSGKVPHQYDTERFPVGPLPGLKGVITGSVIGWYPGVTTSCGASVASSLFGKEDERGYISIVSSIGTSSTMFAFIALAVSGKERSGTMSVVNGILDGMSVHPYGAVFPAIMVAMTVSTVIAYFVMISAGKVMCTISENINTDVINKVILVLMILMTLLFTGYWGLVLLMVCTFVGMIPIVLGTNRIHLTACLIVPVLLFRLGLI